MEVLSPDSTLKMSLFNVFIKSLHCWWQGTYFGSFNAYLLPIFASQALILASVVVADSGML